MSLIDIMLSRKEVVLSLVLVGMIMLIALGLAIGPGIVRSWKKTMAKRKAQRDERTAKLTQQKKNKRGKRSGQPNTGQRKRAPVTASETPVADPSIPPVVVAAAEIVPPSAPVAPAVLAPAAFTEPEQPVEVEPASDIQDLLNSVFTDDETVARYEVLLRGIQEVSTEELLTLATTVAQKLRAAKHNPA